MPKLLVHTPFNLLLDHSSERIKFAAGLHRDVSEEVADHWYTLQHATVIEAGAPQGEVEPVIEGAGTVAEGGEGGGDGGEGGQGGAGGAETIDLTAKSDDELRALIKERSGRLPHPNTGREKLLAMAAAEPGAQIEGDGTVEGGEGTVSEQAPLAAATADTPPPAEGAVIEAGAPQGEVAAADTAGADAQA